MNYNGRGLIMKYLITRGAGFIGSNIIRELLKKGEQVRVLDNFATGYRKNNLFEFKGNANFWVKIYNFTIG